jgi:hypothetical protein
MIYGAHVATTVLPIAAHFIFDIDLPFVEKLPLLGFYMPYFAIPLMLTVHMAFTPNIFGIEDTITSRKLK